MFFSSEKSLLLLYRIVNWWSMVISKSLRQHWFAYLDLIDIFNHSKGSYLFYRTPFKLPALAIKRQILQISGEIVS